MRTHEATTNEILKLLQVYIYSIKRRNPLISQYFTTIFNIHIKIIVFLLQRFISYYLGSDQIIIMGL